MQEFTFLPIFCTHTRCSLFEEQFYYFQQSSTLWLIMMKFGTVLFEEKCKGKEVIFQKQFYTFNSNF